MGKKIEHYQQMRKTITIIIPNYNYAHYIQKSLRAIFNQSRKPDKIIIIDDGSTDNSVQIIQEMIKDLDYVTLITNKINVGITNSVNKALDLVTTDYVGYAASDDRMTSNYIFETMNYLEKHSESALCFSLPAFFNNSNKYWFDDFNILETLEIEPLKLVKLLKKTKFWIATHTSIFKTSEIKSYRQHSSLKHYSDWFFMLHLAFRKKIGFIPKPLVYMRIHNVAYSTKKRSYRDFKKIYSFMMDEIDRDLPIIQEQFKSSRALSALDNSLIKFLLCRSKYWKYLPGLIYGKILRLHIRLKRKILKLIK